MTKKLTKSKRPPVGSTVVFGNYFGQPGLGFKIGDAAEVVSTETRKPGGGYIVRLKGSDTRWGYEWFDYPEKVKAVVTYSDKVEDFPIGTRVAALDVETVGEDFRDKVGTVVARVGTSLHVRFDFVNSDEVGANGGIWRPKHFAIISPAPVHNTPTPKASLQKQTSKDYALKARSAKLLTGEQNAILLDASEGKEVDVIEFRKAATAALSAATTRAGQSAGRREFAKEARHLLYWADAIIDQHVKGLPVYEQGARSPRIAELEAEVAKLRTEGSDEVRASIETAKSTIDRLNDALKHSQKDHATALQRYDDLRNDRKVSEDALYARISDLHKERAEFERDVHVLGAVLVYVGEVVEDPIVLSNILGYWTGVDDTTPDA